MMETPKSDNNSVSADAVVASRDNMRPCLPGLEVDELLLYIWSYDVR